VFLALGLLLLAVGGAAGAYRAAYREGDAGPLPGPRDGVVLIVTDNVRADHTSLCGYARSTTPGLEAFARAPGAVSTCRAYVPGSWTLPSHASFFTGQGPLEHGAHEYRGEVKDPRGSGITTHKLKSEVETLAEQMRLRGYQTVLLAGNPVVSGPTGLAQGFTHVYAARAFGDLDWPELVDRLRELIRRELEPLGGPLFLVVNLAEAHRPWKGVPRDHAYLPRRGRLQFDNTRLDSPWREILEGRISKEDREQFLGHITDVYDYGIERADKGVGEVLRAVRETGWCGANCRVVVTSDHGEFIGEHDLVDHGFYAWEANARVFVAAQGVDVEALPEPFPAVAVYRLLRDGTLPEPLPAVELPAWPHVRRHIHSLERAFGSVSLARWSGWSKLMWMDGEFFQFDLRADPGEGVRLPLDPDANFAATARRVEAAQTRDPSALGDEDADMIEMLEAAGYMQ